MKNKNLLVILLVSVALASAGMAYAQSGFLDGGSNNPAPGTFANVGGGTFQGILLYALGIMLQLIGIVSTIFLVVGGYLYVTGGTNEKQIEKAKSTIWNAIIGFAITVLAFVILKVVEYTVRSGAG